MIIEMQCRDRATALRGSPIRRATSVAAVSLVLLTAGQRALADMPDARAAIDRGDCKAAGEAINQGLSRNDAEAFYLAGFLYDQSGCVQPDAARAARLYQRALALGDNDAAIPLGLLFALGKGVPQDYAMAHRAYSGDKPAASDASATPAELAEIGYVETIAQVASHRVAYPMSANAEGIEATMDVVFTPGSGLVEFERVHVDTEIGRSIPRTRDFTDAVKDAYRDVMTKLPRPDIGADPSRRFVTPWQFSMPRTVNNRKSRLEGVVTVGETSSMRRAE